MKKLVFAGVAAIGLAGGMQPAVADEFMDLSSMAREVVAASPGVETIMPYFIAKDSTADGIPDTLYVKYNVYAGGTQTLLHSSTQKAVTFPAIPCTAPAWKNFEFEPKFLGKIGTTRAHMALLLTVECTETGTGEWKEADKAFVYSADVSVAGGTVWTYGVARELAGFDAVDVTGDGVNELMLTTIYPIDPLNEAAGQNSVVRFMNATTGALVSEKGYALVRP